MPTLKETLPKEIRERRLEMNLSQEQLAELVKKSTGLIGQYERGETFPSPDTLSDLVSVLAIDLNKLTSESSQQDNKTIIEINSLIDHMNPTHQLLMLEFARLLYKHFYHNTQEENEE